MNADQAVHAEYSIRKNFQKVKTYGKGTLMGTIEMKRK